MHFNQTNNSGNNLTSCQVLLQDNLKNIVLPGGFIPEEQLDAMPMTSILSGSWGPIEWEVDANIDITDINNSYFKVKVSVFGMKVVDTTLNFTNPNINVDLTISGVGVVFQVGVDFVARRVYIKGVLDFVFYKKPFDITILKF